MSDFCEECGLPVSEFDLLEVHCDDSGVYHDGCYRMLVQQDVSEYFSDRYVRPSKAQIMADADFSTFERYGI